MPALASAKHEKFAREIANGANHGAAYIAAGYTSNPNSAAVGANTLLKNAKITARIDELVAERDMMAIKSVQEAVQALAIDREWVMGLLKENAERALQRVPVRDAEGSVVEYKYDGAVANRALELLGKEMGMFIDRKEIGGPGDFARMNDAELDAVIAEGARALGLGAPGETASGLAAGILGPRRLN
jgi:phage terminase small subunit